jgi:hypothetical protein
LKEGNACARIGYSNDNPIGTGWNEFDTAGDIKNFNAGNNEIWMVNVHNEVYRRTDVDHTVEAYSTGTEWEQVLGLQSFVTTAEDSVTWAIDAEGEVWRWKGGLITIEEIINNVDHEWTHIPQKQLIRLDVGYNSQVVGIEDQGGNVLFRTGVTQDSVSGDNWDVLGNGFTDVTMCRNGFIWATDGQTVQFRTGIVDEVNNQGQGWEIVDNLVVTSMNCGFRGALWVTTAAGTVQMRENVNSYNWKGTSWMNIALPQVNG